MAAEQQRAEQPANKSQAAPAPWLEKHRFQPGQSGNPGGRPKGTVDLSGRIRKALEKRIAEDRQVADQLAERLVEFMFAAPDKATRLIRDFMDRDEGPVEKGGPLVSIDARGNDGKPKPPPAAEGRKQAQQFIGILMERGGLSAADILGAVDADIIEGKVERDGEDDQT